MSTQPSSLKRAEEKGPKYRGQIVVGVIHLYLLHLLYGQTARKIILKIILWASYPERPMDVYTSLNRTKYLEFLLSVRHSTL